MSIRSRQHRPLFARSEQDRYLLGVAAGLANALGVASVFVRIGFVLLALVPAVGIGAYLIATLVSAPSRGTLGDEPPRAVTVQRTAGFACVVAGSIIFFQTLGLGAIPNTLLPSGAALLAMTLVATLVVLVLTPWLVSLYRQLSNERRERIRSEERAELAAHLHDSVLHTLALIQRADASAEVVSLARRQERELRSWLLGRSGTTARLRNAVDELVTRVEASYPVKVDVVVVGDCAVDERVQALVHACQEAAVNAARHADVVAVSVYFEVEPDRITAYVRDSGKGFDPAGVADDRRGISESIHGRMARVGGVATVRSAPGDGTEVELHVDRSSNE